MHGHMLEFSEANLWIPIYMFIYYELHVIDFDTFLDTLSFGLDLHGIHRIIF